MLPLCCRISTIYFFWSGEKNTKPEGDRQRTRSRFNPLSIASTQELDNYTYTKELKHINFSVLQMIALAHRNQRGRTMCEVHLPHSQTIYTRNQYTRIHKEGLNLKAAPPPHTKRHQPPNFIVFSGVVNPVIYMYRFFGWPASFQAHSTPECIISPSPLPRPAYATESKGAFFCCCIQ